MAEKVKTQYMESKEGIRFAYRRFGKTNTVPLVLHIHFRGNMDFWDPLLLNTIAREREVILFDNAGVGKSSGQVPRTFEGWAKDMIAFIRSLDLNQVDVMGFSMGGLAVTYAALNAPGLVRKLIIAGSKASAPANHVAGIVWPQDDVDLKYTQAIVSATSVDEGREALMYGLFPENIAAGKAFDEYWARISSREAEAPQLDPLPMEPGGANQVAAVIDSNQPNPQGSFHRLGELKIPVLVANGDNDVLIPTSRSWELLTQIENAQLIIYPRSGHGFLWQYAQRFGEDVNRFLDGVDFEQNI